MPTTALRKTRRPTCVDLFAGAGGLSLGIEQAGFDIVAAVEIDPIHAAAHKYNFPQSAVLCCDVKRVDGGAIRKQAGVGRSPIDLVVGGAPCQGFSFIGKRAMRDTRNSLVFHFLRLVDELRPRYFVFENVPGMAAGKHAAYLDQLLEGFEATGYRAAAKILNAAQFGVPQNRRRLFIIGARRGLPTPVHPSPLMRPPGSKLAPDHPLATLPECPSVADAIGDLPDIDEWESLLETDALSIALPPGSDYAMRLRSELTDPSDYSYPRTREEKLLTGCLRARHTELSRERFTATAPGDIEPISRFHKLPLTGISNTLRSGTNTDRGAFSAPRPIHPVYPRCISVREAARLHSYPDWFRFHYTKWHGFRQIGNSVPPLLGRAVGRSITEALEVRGVKPGSIQPDGDSALVKYNMSQAARHFSVSSRVIRRRRRRKADARA